MSEVEELRAEIASLRAELEMVKKMAKSHYLKTTWLQAKLLPETLPAKARKPREAKEGGPKA
jgi:hypothetical protein